MYTLRKASIGFALSSVLGVIESLQISYKQLSVDFGFQPKAQQQQNTIHFGM